MADFNAQQIVSSSDLDPSESLPDPIVTQTLFDLGSGGGSQPVIDNFTPAVGTPIDRDTTISFDVTDDTGLLRAEIFVTLGGQTFVVHDGEKFRGDFTNYSTRTAIVGGFRYNVRPNGGWTKAPTFEVHAVDISGQEA